jgi:hypothetical protein
MRGYCIASVASFAGGEIPQSLHYPVKTVDTAIDFCATAQ